MDYLDSFIETINEYLIQNNLTLTEFAKRAKISEQGVSQWLTKKNTPSLEYCIKIADFMNCSLDFLVGRTQTPNYIRSVKNHTFCERLESLLSQKGESFYYVSAQCGFGNSIYAKWKKGKNPKPEKLILLSNYFNVSLDYLVGRSDSI